MKLHIIRHAEALAPTPELPDELRYLTCRGRRRFRQVAAALKKLEIDPDLILTSPKARALQTAEILAEALAFSGEVQVSPLLAENFTVDSLRQLLLNLPRSRQMTPKTSSPTSRMSATTAKWNSSATKCFGASAKSTS
jgi:phosphohistidine phosphatase SixA